MLSLERAPAPCHALGLGAGPASRRVNRIVAGLAATAGALLLSAGAAAKVFDEAGVSAPFLKIAQGARASAMGEAFTAAAEEASAVHYNPAGLASLDALSVQLSHAFYLQSITYQFVGVAQPLAALFHQFDTSGGRLPAYTKTPDWGVLGLGFVYLNAGSFDKTDNTGAPAGSFTPQDFAASLTYARAFGPLDFGATAKLVSTMIDRSAKTYAADLGARYRTGWEDHPWTFAAAVTHMGGKLKVGRQQDPLPLTVAVGQSFRFAPELLVATDFISPKDDAPYLALGAEFSRSVKKDLDAALRLGYSTVHASDGLGGIAGLTAGAGIAFPHVRFDYAWVPFGLLGQTHRFTLAFRF